jgi:hypothetical protein
VQLGRQAGQRPVPGEVGLEQAHRLHDGRMRRSGAAGRFAVGFTMHYFVSGLTEGATKL